MKKIMRCLLVVFVFISSQLFAQENNIIKIRAATNFNQMSSVGKNLRKMKEIIEAKFPGKIKFIIEDSLKYTEVQELEALDLGALDFVVSETEIFSKYYGARDFELFNLPYLFSSVEDLKKFQQSIIPNMMIDNFILKNQSIQPMGIWFGDFNVIAGKTAIKNKNSFSGKRVGVFSSEINSIVYKSFGASDVILLHTRNDIPTYLERKINTGIGLFISPLETILFRKFYENISDITLFKNTPSGTVVLTNRAWLSKLPPEIRDEIIKMVKNISIASIDDIEKTNERAIKAIDGSKIKIYKPSVEEVEEFKKASVPSHEYFIKNINEQLLVETYRLFKK